MDPTVVSYLILVRVAYIVDAEVTVSIAVEVAGSIPRYDEQKAAALLIFNDSTTSLTPSQMCGGMRSRRRVSSSGDALVWKMSTASAVTRQL